MKRRQSVLGIASLLLVGALLSACPPEDVTRNSVARGTLTVKAVDATGLENNFLAADGTSYLLLQIQARDADGASWSGAVNLTTDLGAFAAAQPSDSIDVTTDAEGQATVQFICGQPGSGDPENPGEATVTVRNAQTQARLSLYCEPVQDRREVILSAPSGTVIHYADGFHEVPLTASVFNLSGEPEGGASVQFESSVQALVNGASLSTQVRANTNALGQAQAFLKAPTTPQTIQVKAMWTYDPAESPKQDTVNVNFAADSSDIVLDSDRQTAPADGSASIALTATALGFDGQAMPEGTPVDFIVNEPYGFGSPAVTTVQALVVGDQGEATANLNATLTQGQAVVTAEFTVAAGQVRRSNPLSLEFVEPGQMTLLLTAEPNNIFTDDQEVATMTVKVERDGVVLDGQEVTFSINVQDAALGTFGLQGAVTSLSSVTRTTDSEGLATTELRGFYPGAAGTIMVTVSTLDAQNGNEVVTVSEAVLLKRHPMLQSVVFMGAEPAILGTRGSPRPSTAIVTFQALDDNNVPMEGVDFRFIRPDEVDPTVVITTAGGGDSAVSDSTGTVVAYLAAGVQAGPVRVIARATDPRTGLILEVTSDSIPIISGLSSWSHSWFVCEEEKSALTPPDSRSCQVVLADRFSERVGEGAAVQFRVEAGNIDPSAVTGGDGSTADVSYLTGWPLPSDTPDIFGDLGTRNPTDRLVNMLAYTRGEEPFTDVNGDGIYEPGEPFVDFPEPYVDKQDNCARNDATDPNDQMYLDPSIYPTGVADPYEVMMRTDTFVDGNNDGVWNGANGVWDDDTMIWFQQQTLWVYPWEKFSMVDVYCTDSGVNLEVGYPTYTNPEHRHFLRRCDTFNDVKDDGVGGYIPTPHSVPWLDLGERVEVRFRAVDGYGNCPAPGASASYSWSAENAEGTGTSPVGARGCGLTTGAFGVDPVTGHVLPYCSVYANLDIDSDTLVINSSGVGSYPETAEFETGTSVIGEPIKLTASFEGGAEQSERSRTYVVPCQTDVECGADVATNDDAGTSTAPTGPTCQVSTGLCVGGSN